MFHSEGMHALAWYGIGNGKVRNLYYVKNVYYCTVRVSVCWLWKGVAFEFEFMFGFCISIVTGNIECKCIFSTLVAALIFFERCNLIGRVRMDRVEFPMAPISEPYHSVHSDRMANGHKCFGLHVLGIVVIPFFHCVFSPLDYKMRSSVTVVQFELQFQPSSNMLTIIIRSPVCFRHR